VPFAALQQQKQQQWLVVAIESDLATPLVLNDTRHKPGWISYSSGYGLHLVPLGDAVTSSSTAALLRQSLLDDYLYSCSKSTPGGRWSQVEHPIYTPSGTGNGSAREDQSSAKAVEPEVGAKLAKVCCWQ
jgi:hypothetical protein